MSRKIWYSYKSYPDNQEATDISHSREETATIIFMVLGPCALLSFLFFILNLGKGGWIFFLIVFVLCVLFAIYMFTVYPKRTEEMIQEALRRQNRQYKTRTGKMIKTNEFQYCAICHDVGYVDDGLIMYDDETPLCTYCNKLVNDLIKSKGNRAKQEKYLIDQVRKNKTSPEGKALISSLTGINVG